MADTASVVYWYDEENLPLDGGGIRALAWKAALSDAGFDTDIVAIHPGPVDTRPPSIPTRLKRMAAPMPLAKRPPKTNADLVVTTVPGTFPSYVRDVRANSREPALIFDWMDRWSINARTMGGASPLSALGGAIQGHIWGTREPLLSRAPRANTFAGYADFQALGQGKDLWLPTPVRARGHRTRKRTRVHRVGFIGNLHYEPNEFSLRWFLRRYASEFDSRGIAIVVAGFGSERVRDWGFPVSVAGSVSDIEDFYQEIDAAIVPIRHGGGIKVKAVEALALGVPVLGTPHVREGFRPGAVRDSILDIDDFLASDDLELDPPSIDAILAQFGQSEFNASVRRLADAVFR